MTRSYNAIELFAGAGGLALGLQLSGFTMRALVERDPNCCETLRFNAPRYFPNAVVIRRDIRRLSAAQLLAHAGLLRQDVDLISAGPPCQSFSISKIPKGGRSDEDPRDGLLSHYVRFVRKIRPAALLFENVLGLLSKSDGRLFRDFLRSLEGLGYRTKYSIINAADYGVPQRRRRLFVLGSSDGFCELDFPRPTYGPNCEARGKREYVSIQRALSKLKPSLPNQRLPKNTGVKRKLLGRIRPGSEWKHWRHRDSWNGPSRCITAHCRDDWVHPKEPRAGTVRELATLQSFPTRYVFCGPFNAPNNSEFSFQYRQVGNSVPVLMAKAIGESLIEKLPRSTREAN